MLTSAATRSHKGRVISWGQGETIMDMHASVAPFIVYS